MGAVLAIPLLLLNFLSLAIAGARHPSPSVSAQGDVAPMATMAAAKPFPHMTDPNAVVTTLDEPETFE